MTDEPTLLLVEETLDLIIKELQEGGQGSGNYGHLGRPGKIGGSAPGNFKPGEAPEVQSEEEMMNGSDKFSDSFREGLPDFVKYSPPYQLREDLANQKIEDLSKDSGVPQETIQQTYLTWVSDSNESEDALTIQEATRDEFGVPLSDYQERALKRIGTNPEGVRVKLIGGYDTQRTLLRAMYENTQEYLKGKGYSPDDMITLYRGISRQKKMIERYSDNEVVNYVGNALESWSADYSTAFNFATGLQQGRYVDKPGLVVSMRVPVKNIVSMFRSGIGSLPEYEFVILGSTPGSRARIVKRYFP